MLYFVCAAKIIVSRLDSLLAAEAPEALEGARSRRTYRVDDRLVAGGPGFLPID